MITFASWLRTQTNRNDEVGCLATQVYGDDCMPLQADYATVIAHIQEHQGGCIEGPLLIHIGVAKDAYDADLRTLSL